MSITAPSGKPISRGRVKSVDNWERTTSSSSLATSSRPAPAVGDFYERALALQIEGIRASFQYLPSENLRAFYEWILDHEELRNRWLGLVSVNKTIQLTEKLLAGLLTDEEMDFLLPYTVAINTYLMYEVVSDNLAIGLAARQPYDTTYDERRQLLRTFNTALAQRIRDEVSWSADEALRPLGSQLQAISTFHQSLNVSQHTRIAAAYIREKGDTIRVHDLEYNVYPSLVANFQACVTFENVMRGYDFFPVFQNALARRYESTNVLLNDDSLSIRQLAEIGTDTILVVPTIGYYAAIIGETLRPTAAYRAVVEDGSLLAALREASLLVRLLNDLGTRVLEQSEAEQQDLIAWLYALQAAQPGKRFPDLLLDAVQTYGTPLTRLKKDLVFGEFNIGLHSILSEDDPVRAIDQFAERLADLSQLYRQNYQQLADHIRILSRRMESAVIGEVIMRFVRFHQVVYSQSYEDGSGEYAI